MKGIGIGICDIINTNQKVQCLPNAIISDTVLGKAGKFPRTKLPECFQLIKSQPTTKKKISIYPKNVGPNMS